MVEVDDEIGKRCVKPNVRGPPRGPFPLGLTRQPYGFQGHCHIGPTIWFKVNHGLNLTTSTYAG